MFVNLYQLMFTTKAIRAAYNGFSYKLRLYEHKIWATQDMYVIPTKLNTYGLLSTEAATVRCGQSLQHS